MNENDWLLLAEEKAKTKNIVDEKLSFENFLGACYVKCVPQSYGPKIEKRIKNDFNFNKIPQKKNEGDLLVTESTKFEIFNFNVGEKIEFKMSYFTGESWNLLQIRPYQKFEYYLFLLINPFEKCKQDWYVIKKQDLENEFKLGGCHGTKESNEKNENIEYRLTIKENSIDHLKLKEINQINNTASCPSG